ncbi:MAG: class I SAM-dependent methyltransferase [Candidatus Hermodarchaeota archaeon]
MTDKSKTPWHEDDEMWAVAAPLMFDEARLAQAPREVDSLTSLLAIQPDDRILDLCCGVGRHSLEFARRGHKVVGVDRTEPYLERAKASAANENLDIEFVLEDMRSFRRESTFDVTLSMFTSFGYFEDPEDQMRVLRNIHFSLEPGGRFVYQSFGKEVLARIFLPKDWEEYDKGFVLYERKAINDWSMMHNKWHFIEREGKIHTWEFQHWIYSAAEMKGMLMDAGFSEARVYGNLDGAAYDNEATMIVAVATK